MWKKILLACLLLALVAGGWFWSQKDEWLAEFNAERAEEAERFRSAGLEFGQTHDQQACLDKALSDFDSQCSGFSCTVKYGRFLDACLETARPAPAFCEGVPPYREEPSEEDKSWARDTCWGQDIRGEGCRLLLRQQQYFCSAADGAVAADSAAH
jgi:hypothetical protein